jgi:hypothetical protein
MLNTANLHVTAFCHVHCPQGRFPLITAFCGKITGCNALVYDVRMLKRKGSGLSVKCASLQNMEMNIGVSHVERRVDYSQSAMHCYS